jgi:hypothetical protein
MSSSARQQISMEPWGPGPAEPIVWDSRCRRLRKHGRFWSPWAGWKIGRRRPGAARCDAGGRARGVVCGWGCEDRSSGAMSQHGTTTHWKIYIEPSKPAPNCYVTR